MASLIRYFGYLTLLAYGRAPTQPLWLVHARLSEYRKERDVGKRLSTQKGRARIFHKLKGSARFEQLNRSDPSVLASLHAKVRRRSRCVHVACKCSSRRHSPRAKVRRRFRCVRGWVAPNGLQGMRVRGLPPQSTQIGTAQSTQIGTAQSTQIGTATGPPRIALGAALGATLGSHADSAATPSTMEAAAAGAGAAAASCELEESYGVSLPKLEPCCEGWQLCVGEEDVEALEDGTWALRYPNSIFTA